MKRPVAAQQRRLSGEAHPAGLDEAKAAA